MPATLVSPAEAVALTRTFADLMAGAPVFAFVKDAEGRYLYVNERLLAAFGQRMAKSWYGKTDFDFWPPDVATMLRDHDLAAMRDGALRVFRESVPFADAVHTLLVMKFPLGANSTMAGIAFDLTEREQDDGQRFRLATAVEQVAESVMIVDLDARITYVNPAFERVTGYARGEVIGHNPRVISSGLHPRAFYEAMWASLTTGNSWVADFINRRKDGSLFNEEAVISPIQDAFGALTGYIAVKRDVTNERGLEEKSVLLARERALIAETIRGLRPADTPEATAQAICRQVNSLAGIMAARLLVFDLDGRTRTFGFVIAGEPDPPLGRVPHLRSRSLRQRAVEGPWIEAYAGRPWRPHNVTLAALDAHLAAYAPIRYGGEVIGLLAINAAGSVDQTALSDRLPALVEFADLAGAVMGRDLNERSEVRSARARVRKVIDRRAFGPVFQLIVDISGGAVVGYEALTRFADGVSPDVRFAKAAALGLGLELETATPSAALEDATSLPADTWLNLNVSPAMIEAGAPLRTLLHGTARRLVLEVTEHAVISDYVTFREALANLGPNVVLAVDDAGAGFASLRHILELRPAFVKLDRWLIAGLDVDPARQAMIAGLHHFARATGCRLIAEGIETEAELQVLRALDVHLGQGFVLGRPAPMEPT